MVYPADKDMGALLIPSLRNQRPNLISGFIGAGVPLVLKRFNVDPALATGPFVTTSNYILSLLIYLGLATLFLQMKA